MFETVRWIAIVLLAAYAVTQRSLTAWILVGLAAGAELGHDASVLAMKFQVLGTIFLRLIKVIIAPLLFGTLVVGIAGHADIKKVGRMGIKAIVYFEIVSTIAIFIGLAAINISRAGVGIQMPASASENVPAVVPHTATDLILNVFPENIAKSVAEGQVLQVVVFSILFGIALAMVPEAKRKPLVALAESLSETMFKFTNIVMLAAPVGVFGSIAYTVGQMGLGVLLPLLKLLATMYVALVAFVAFVLWPIAYFAKVPILRFAQAVAEPVTIAFATASSEAALPRAMENMEALGVPRSTVAFVLPTGYSFNLDGSSLYQSLALIFMAQAAGVHLHARPADPDDDDVAPQQQRHGRSGACVTGNRAGDCNAIQSADRAIFSILWHRSADGHAANRRECAGKLSCNCRGGRMGRRVPAEARLERQAKSHLRSKRNSHRGSRTEEIAKRAGRNAKLIEARDRHAASGRRAQSSCIGQIVHRNRKRGNISDESLRPDYCG